MIRLDRLKIEKSEMWEVLKEWKWNWKGNGHWYYYRDEEEIKGLQGLHIMYYDIQCSGLPSKSSSWCENFGRSNNEN